MTTRSRAQTRRLQFTGIDPTAHNDFVALLYSKRGTLARLAFHALGPRTPMREAVTLYAIFDSTPSAAAARIPHETPRRAKAIQAILDRNAAVTARVEAAAALAAKAALYVPDAPHTYTYTDHHELPAASRTARALAREKR